MTHTAYRKPKISRTAAQQNNYLGDKLQKKFSGRVSSAAGRAAPQSKAVKGARERINPFDSSVKTNAKNSSPNYIKANAYIHTQSRPNQAQKSASAASQQARAKTYNMSGAATVNAGIRVGQAGRTRSESISANKAKARAEARKRAAEAAISRETARIKAQEKALREEKKRIRAAQAKAKKLELRKERLEEKKVKVKPISPVLLLMMVLCTAMVMVIIYSYTEIYDYTGEISTLKETYSKIEKEEAELKLELEIRDDIRTIEKIATGTIGMVKADLVQKRFISLNDQGDRIELIDDVMSDNVTVSESGRFSTILSSISENFGRFLEYIK